MSQPKAENQIDYIELPVSQIASTEEFYGAAFGWKFEDYGPAYTSFFDGRLAGGFTTDRPAPGHGLIARNLCQRSERRPAENQRGGRSDR